MIDVVGLAARGWVDLPERERGVVAAADVLIAGVRLAALVPVGPGQEVLPLPSPLRPGLPDLLAGVAERRAVVLASGDPLVFGIGSTLVDLLGAEAVRVHPGVSSLALARARLGWPEESCDVVSVVGRDLDLVRRRLAPGARVLVLSADGSTPSRLAALLVEAGYGRTEMTVLSELGTDAEARRSDRADSWRGDAPALNVVGLACVASDLPAVLGWVPGLPDEAYDHDGQLTRRDVRASALARLAPVPGELLWDVGAGAGSVGIEWCRADPRCRAVAIERDRARAERIGRNAHRLGVPGLQVVCGAAPEALGGLPAPRAVFVGGGGTGPTIERCWAVLPAGGRLVAHAVTTETEAVLLAAAERYGGELARLAVETLQPIGGYHGWVPARAIVQWSVTR